MKIEDLQRAATPEQIATGPDRYHERLELLHGGHHHDAGSVREERYRGHEIRVVTRYEITLDGRPVRGHMIVSNGGLVHYHGIPNEDFSSAIDVIKRVIDVSGGSAGAGHSDEDGEEHDHHDRHAGENGGH